jgi:S-methylmethionine-dependent homocysteine/selenocysteine methylase
MSITLLDGGMGQELLARSSAMPTGLWSTQTLMDAPELVRAVHSDYFAAGADIATTNSYAIHRDRLRPFGAEDRFADLHRLACKIAVSARDNHGYGLVAGSMGPTGWSYRPDLAPPEEQAAELYAEIAKLHAPYVDLILCETMSSVAQARGAVMGARVVAKPIWLAVTVDDEDGSKLRSGESVTQLLPIIAEFKIKALLVNCSLPEAVSQAIPLLAIQGVRVGGYANGFVKIAKDFMKKGATVDILQKRSNLGPEIYADFADSWIKDGATIVGGCCEVGPEHIKELARRIKNGAKGNFSACQKMESSFCQSKD